MAAAEISHDVLAALIGAVAIIGAAITSGLFAILLVKIRNGHHETVEREDALERRIRELGATVILDADTPLTLAGFISLALLGISAIGLAINATSKNTDLRERLTRMEQQLTDHLRNGIRHDRDS